MALLIAIVVLALVFDYTNGFHDTANAIATSVSTRALSPRVAVIMAAGLNLLGALVSTSVAKTVGEGIVDTDLVTLHGRHGRARRRRGLELRHVALRHPLQLLPRALRRPHRRHDRQRRASTASSGAASSRRSSCR